ncbi:MAG: hypothetical protein V7700_08100 [Halioglobus sp.]
MALIVFVSVSSAHAQQPPFDCSGSSAHRQFDFWIGGWVVSDAQGTVQGANSIQLIQNGCALQEQWRGIKGSSGESINYYHPGENKWHQLWVDGGTSILDISGGLEKGSMVLRGSIYYLASGNSKSFRGTWTPLPDDRVRQFFEEQDEAGLWQTWFEGFYKRK